MRLHFRSKRRQGTVLPLVAVSLVGLVGFTALAIDLGMLLVAHTECQHAADCAAMAGARTLNGDIASNNNYANAGPNVITAATACKVFNQQIQSSWVHYEIGYYTYDRNTNTFGKLLPSSGETMPSNESWSLATVTVNFGNPSFFAKVLGISTLQTSAVATAVHRPRDIAIIIDLSGSMSFDSLLGGNYNGARTQSLNPETVYPQFGQYSAFNPVATSVYTLSDGEVLGLANVTVNTDAGTPIVNDFYQNALGAALVPAFTAAPASFATTPDGDLPLKTNMNAAGQPYASRLQDVLGSTSYNAGFETNGYSFANFYGGTSKTFYGYTTGPSYWGKTFFIWPPDPRAQYDWRKLFFLKADQITPLDDNSLLWTTGTSAVSKAPRTASATNYYINYAQILRWLRNTGPNPFPSQLRAGRIYYYTAIPDPGTTTATDPTFNARFYVQDPVDLNERFWKHYIDYVLGFYQSATGPVYSIINANVGYGDDFTWGSKSISAKPVAGVNGEPSPARYMNYADNPPRGKTRWWFSPMTMIDFIDNYNQYLANQRGRWMPGTAHQASSWGCKIGMRAAIQDIEKNHPNDYCCLSFFDSPQTSSTSTGRFNRVRTPLGRSYSQMIDKLFYPPITVDNQATYPEINCYDATNMNPVPHAQGSTTPSMSFMQAYNQFATSSSLATYNPSGPLGDAGGLGRKGAQKVVIFETDGMVNQAANASFVNNGAYQSYYKIRIPGEYPTLSGSSVDTQLYGIAQAICNMDTASTPGYSSVRKPALIHCIAYGSLFDPSVSPGAGTTRSQALGVLQQIQYIGKTQSDPTTALQSYKIIIGTADNRINLIKQCVEKIMRDSVSVTLIE